MALVRGAVDQRFFLLARDPMPPLANPNLLLYWNNMIIQDLPGLNLYLYCAQGMLIAANISGLVLEHHKY